MYAYKCMTMYDYKVILYNTKMKECLLYIWLLFLRYYPVEAMHDLVKRLSILVPENSILP